MPSIFASVSPTVKVVIEQSDIFLHPGTDPSLPGDDQVLRGAIILSLPRPRAISSLHARLQGVESYTGGTGWSMEQETILEKELKIDLKEEVLPAGESVYEFSFIVPGNSATYQRCTYGRTYHFVTASVKFPGAFTSTVVSSPAGVWLVGNPCGPGEVPTTFTDTLTGFHDNLGPISITVSSPHLTISSLLLYEAFLLSPPAGVEIASVKGFVTQTFKIHYDDKVANPPTQTHVFFHTVPGPYPSKLPSTKYAPSPSSEESQIRPVEEGKEWTYRHLARLPHDDVIRPTTLEHSLGRIRVNHALGLEIKYRKNGAKEEVITLSKKALITSCCCLRDSLSLPSYSKDPDHKRVERVDCGCICSTSFKELYEQEAKGVFELTVPDQEAAHVVSPEIALAKTAAVGAARGYSPSRGRMDTGE